MSHRPEVRFRVRCASCGPVRVARDHVALHFGDASSTCFRYRCPTCGLVHLEPAPPAAVAAVIDAEVGCFRDVLADDAVVDTAMQTLVTDGRS